MKITNIHRFLEVFFTEHQCDILQNEQGVLTIQLTEEMDKALMNRPFYWHYVKSTGRRGEPMKLTLVTDFQKKNTKGEWIHFGSPRLQQLMNHLHKQNTFIKLFQQVDATERTPLYPWLLTNLKVSYKGKQRKEEIFSIGLSLVNGMMKTEMMNLLTNFSLQPAISDYCYVISPLIKLRSGFKRIEHVLDDYVGNQSHEWANESLHTLQQEIEMIKHFFQKKDDSEQLAKEISALKKRYTPEISYEVLNGGIVYLTDPRLH